MAQKRKASIVDHDRFYSTPDAISFEKIVKKAAETEIDDAWNIVIRKAAEIELDEGNPRELFDRIGLRPFIQEEKKHIRAAKAHLSHSVVKGANDRLYIHYP